MMNTMLNYTVCKDGKVFKHDINCLLRKKVFEAIMLIVVYNLLKLRLNSSRFRGRRAHAPVVNVLL